MRKGALIIVVAGLTAAALWGCGGGGGGGSGPGEPGSSGSGDTGVILSATVQPVYLDTNTSSVDVVRQDDCDGDSTTIDPEPFTDHGAAFTFTARLLNPNTTFRAGDIFIEKYTIQYRRSQDSIGAPPIQQYEAFSTMRIQAPSSDNVVTVQDSGVLVDLTRKIDYEQALQSGQFTSGAFGINNYTAIYTFTGQNEFGEDVELQAEANFQIGSFDNCQR
ncbi:MAG: hypothetical protein ACM3ON_09790 [Chloroflexota bacterium]